MGFGGFFFFFFEVFLERILLIFMNIFPFIPSFVFCFLFFFFVLVVIATLVQSPDFHFRILIANSGFLWLMETSKSLKANGLLSVV